MNAKREREREREGERERERGRERERERRASDFFPPSAFEPEQNLFASCMNMGQFCPTRK